MLFFIIDPVMFSIFDIVTYAEFYLDNESSFTFWSITINLNLWNVSSFLSGIFEKIE